MIKALRRFFRRKSDVLPPPCRTLDREPYSKQFSYIYRLARRS